MLVGIVSAVLSIIFLDLWRSFGQLPAKELKNRARDGDKDAASLHQAVAYGASLQLLLTVLVILSVWSSLLFLGNRQDNPLVSFLIMVVVGVLLLIKVPGGPLHEVEIWLATTLAPVLAWVMRYIHTPLDVAARTLGHLVPKHHHTGLYEKNDLLELLRKQGKQTDSRITSSELELAKNAIRFGDERIRDRMTPKRKVRAVSVKDSIGPILMDELHATGSSRFPVYEGKKDNIVGSLFLKDLVDTKASATIESVMRRSVGYVHEDQSMHEALQAVLKTHHHLLIVLNSQEEYVGVLHIEAILEPIVGKALVDEFDQYDDRHAVAARTTEKVVK